MKVQTEYGEGVESTTPPGDTRFVWVKLPERHLYIYDLDWGWRREKPPEIDFNFSFDKELDHG